MNVTAKIIYCVLTSLAFECLAPLPHAKAVSPPPDGGYPGGNTAEGEKALFSLASGRLNTAIGWMSLETNSTGQLNTAIGAATLSSNSADQNTAVGAATLLLNSTGMNNTANGAFALASKTTPPAAIPRWVEVRSWQTRLAV
jgi:hypothetical protein